MQALLISGCPYQTSPNESLLFSMTATSRKLNVKSQTTKVEINTPSWMKSYTLQLPIQLDSHLVHKQHKFVTFTREN